MRKIDTYIIEKLRINKDTNTTEVIDSKDLFSFLKKYIFDNIQRVNDIALSSVKAFLNIYNNDYKFKIYATEEHKQIWGQKDFKFIEYHSENEINDLTKKRFSDNNYMGGGIYFWHNRSDENKVLASVDIADNNYNDFDKGFPSILIVLDK